MRPSSGTEDMTPPEASTGLENERLETVRVWLLGGFRVSVGSRTIADGQWHLRKAAALVKMLALAPNHHLHREQVMNQLWPDSGRKAASNNLRRVLHATRKVLDPSEGSRYLASEGQQLVLCPLSELRVDVEAFEQAAATARRERKPAAYLAAIDLYAGELLPEERYEEWAEGRRRELRQLNLRLLVELAYLCEERGEYDAAVQTLGKVLAQEPANEEAHAALMRLHALSERPAEALATYERLEEVLSREFGAKPGSATRRLREEIAAGRFPTTRTQPAGFSQEEAQDTSNHNLPAPRTSFVGREREMIEVKRELAMTRLLTLTGAGGSGKTRLALEVARSLIGAYLDGVWLVELAGLSEGELVPQAVAAALGVKEQPGQPLTHMLIESLRPKHLLLVMDNCEHLVEDAARLVDVLLDRCPHVRVLATSREALDVVGEVRWVVPTLAIPDPRRVPTVNELEGYESTRLFLARARNRNPSFAFTPENARAVAQICRQLEGMPLAIELAAARVGALAVEQISEKLEDSLKLLTRGSRTEMPRQQTLRGTLDWSYDLLSKPERVLFRRLSVFAGGCILEAAEAVGSGEGVEEGEVLDFLSGLIGKSLVVAETTAESGLRYRMLEPVRQYAREKLEESGEIEEIQRRHVTFFLALAEEAALAFPGPEEAGWLHRLEAEHDNLRAALSWSLDDGNRGLGVRLAAAIWWFWRGQGHISEGAGWLEETLGKDDRSEPTARAGALYGLGGILAYLSDFGRSQACLEEALALYEELGDRGRVAESLAGLGWTVLFDTVRAKAYFEEALALYEELGDRRDIPRIISGLATIASEEGDFEQAQNLYGDALAMHRQQGEILGAASVLIQTGYTELAWGNHEQARVLFEEALALGRKLKHKQTVAGSLFGRGMVANLQGDPERAETLLKDSLAIDQQFERKALLAENMAGLAEVAGALGQHLRAARLWGAADELRRVSRPWSSTERKLHEPLLLAARNRLDEAAWEAAFAEGEAMGLGDAVQYALSEEQPTTPSTVAPEHASSDQRPALTRREWEVANLVTQGLTNRRIAEELFISERTVDHHVGRILSKLNLSSREQVASRLGNH